MAWRVELTEDAEQDFAALDGSLRKLVRKKLAKLEENPHIGEELHNLAGCDLIGYYKLYFTPEKEMRDGIISPPQYLAE